jgi:MFS family permease
MTVEPPSVSGATAGAPSAEPEPATRLRGGLLRHHDFRQLFVGDSLSQFGTQLSMLALPVLAVKVLDATPFQMGLLGTCEFLAFLVIGLPAGAWVDRWRKKRVLVTNDLLRALALGSLPVAWAADVLSFPQMLLVALVVGCCTVFFDVAYQSYLPDIVEPEHIGEGNAKLQAVQSIAMIGGPAAGGGLIKLIGSPLTVGLDALSFIWSAFWVRRIQHVDTPPPREDRRPMLVEIREGLSFVFTNPLLWRITLCTGTANFFSSMTQAMLVIFVLRDLHLDPGHLGLALGVAAVGGLLGALATPRVNQLVGEGRTIPLSSLFFVPAAALMPLAGTVVPSMVAITVSNFVFTFVVVLYNVTQVSFRQRLCPRPLLGRMNASIRFIVWGTMPIGAFVGGVVGEAVGARNVFWIGVVGAAISALPVVFSPLIRMRDLPRELDRLSETV